MIHVVSVQQKRKNLRKKRQHNEVMTNLASANPLRFVILKVDNRKENTYRLLLLVKQKSGFFWIGPVNVSVNQLSVLQNSEYLIGWAEIKNDFNVKLSNLVNFFLIKQKQFVLLQKMENLGVE